MAAGAAASDKIRVGIVGASTDPFQWGAAAHIPALRALPEYDVVAIASRSQKSAEAAARAHAIPAAYGDYREMLKAPDIDLVCVVTSAVHHHALTMAALDAGKHVYCEWPFGLSSAQAVEMRDRAEVRGVRTIVGLQNRHAPIVAHVRDLIADGYIGELYAVRLDRASDQTTRIKLSESYLDFLERSNAGMNIFAGHALDTLAAYVGELVDLQAYTEIRMKEIVLAGSGRTAPVKTADHILVQGRLAQGAVVSALMKLNSPANKAFHLEISGSKGALIVTTEHVQDPAQRYPGVPTDLFLYGTAGFGRPFEAMAIPPTYRLVPESVPVSQPFNVAQLYRAFSRAQADGTRFDLDFAHGVMRHRLLDTIQAAATSGTRKAFASEAAR